jgi:trigger factor
MQIEIKEIEKCKLSVHYEAGAADILNKRGDVLAAFKKAPVPGFRPGKASIDAIKHHYRDQIEESLKRALAEDAYHNVLFEKKLRPHGAPRFNTVTMADGKFSCDFELATKPEFELAPFRGMEIPKPHEPASETEVTEKLLQELRVRFGEALPYTETDFVQAGDNVILNYEGFVDGTKIDNLSAEGEMLTVGTSPFTQFDDSLLGMALEETREFDLTVPESGLPSLIGKIVHFSVTLVMGSKIIPCPLDDSLAVKLGKKDFAELRELARSTAMANVANTFKAAVNNSVSQRLVSDNTFEVPHWLALSEAQYLAHQSKLDWTVMSDSDKEKFIEMGTKNVKLSLVLDRIRDTEPEAQLTDQEVFDVIKQNLAKSQTKNSVDDVIKEMSRTGYLQILFSRIRDENTLDFVVKNAIVID